MNQNKLIYNLKKVSKFIMYFILSILLVISVFIAYYVVSYKIAESKNEYPPFGIFTAVSGSMEPVISKYDVLLIKKTKIETLKEGDIITFLPSTNIFAQTAITHRVNKIETIDNEMQITTKGDANDTIDAYYVYKDDIYGKVILIIPQIGKLQSYLTENINEKGPYLLIVFLTAFLIIVIDIIKFIKFFVQKKRNDKINNEF